MRCDQILPKSAKEAYDFFCTRKARFTFMRNGEPVERLCLQHLKRMAQYSTRPSGGFTFPNDIVIVDEHGKERQLSEFTY